MIELVNVCKSYGDKHLYNNVNVIVKKGEIHAIFGHNNAGKTTLLKILGAIEEATNGMIRIEGGNYSTREYYIKKPIKSAFLFQELCVFDELTIKENIFLNNHPGGKLGPLNFINWQGMYKESVKLLERFGLNLNPNTKLIYLSYGQKKLIELIKVISQGAELVLLDDPAAFLTDNEKEMIFDVIGQLKDSGITVVFVAHSIQDIKYVADRVTIIKKDRSLESIDVGEIDNNRYLSTQGKLLNRYPKVKGKLDKDILRVKNLCTDSGLQDINFTLRSEEIVGIIGSQSSGCLQFIEALYGIEKITQGEIYINDQKVEINNPHDALTLGISYIGGSNYRKLILGELDIKTNISISNPSRVSNKFFVDTTVEKETVSKLLEMIGIYDKVDCKLKNLSTGEQKKVMLAKGIFSRTKIFIMDNPTSDLDVVSKVDIYNIMNELTHAKASILFLSNDVEELKGMCDRIIIMDKGRVQRIVNRDEYTLL